MKLQVVSNTKGDVIAFNLVPSNPDAEVFASIAPSSPKHHLHEIDIPDDLGHYSSIEELRLHLVPHLQAKGLALLDERGRSTIRRRAGSVAKKETKKAGATRRRPR